MWRRRAMRTCAGSGAAVHGRGPRAVLTLALALALALALRPPLSLAANRLRLASKVDARPPPPLSALDSGGDPPASTLRAAMRRELVLLAPELPATEGQGLERGA